MRTLLILRHAKSSWKDAGLPDHDRPLNKRGKKNAPTMGNLIKSEDILPHWIASSTALRARKTAKAVAKASGFSGTIDYLDALYLAEPPGILETVRRTAPESANRILLVGHNPGLEDLARLLTAQREPFPTCALARIDLPIDSWSELSESSRGELVGLWRPRDFD